MAFSTSRLARVTPLSLLVARKVSRTLEMLSNVSNTEPDSEGAPDTEGASLGIALGFPLTDGNSLGINDGTPDTEGAPLGIVLGFVLIDVDGKILGTKDGTPDAEGAPDTEGAPLGIVLGASLGWGRLWMVMVCKGKKDE